MEAQLKLSGVRRIYGISGDSLNAFIEALHRMMRSAGSDVRHGRPPCGPGNLRIINGLFDANRTNVPVLAIAAQVPTDEIGSSYFQETNPLRLFRECSMYC